MPAFKYHMGPDQRICRGACNTPAEELRDDVRALLTAGSLTECQTGRRRTCRRHAHQGRLVYLISSPAGRQELCCSKSVHAAKLVTIARRVVEQLDRVVPLAGQCSAEKCWLHCVGPGAGAGADGTAVKSLKLAGVEGVRAGCSGRRLLGVDRTCRGDLSYLGLCAAGWCTCGGVCSGAW
jgi:hypothetical protein